MRTKFNRLARYREMGDHTQAQETQMRYENIKCSPRHTNIQAALCSVKEELQFWSHRARSQFPHVMANTQPWEQTCKAKNKKILRVRFWEAEKKQGIYRWRKKAETRERKFIKPLIPQEHHGCKDTVSLGYADSLSVMRYEQGWTNHQSTQTTYIGVGLHKCQEQTIQVHHSHSDFPHLPLFYSYTILHSLLKQN